MRYAAREFIRIRQPLRRGHDGSWPHSGYHDHDELRCAAMLGTVTYLPDNSSPSSKGRADRSSW